jgi:hypothetical protein
MLIFKYMPVSFSIYGSAMLVLLAIVLIRQGWLYFVGKNPGS